jgi:hypothetical protein
LFICFGAVTIAGLIRKKSNPYLVFAVTAGTLCIGTIIAALFIRTEYLAFLPFAAVILGIDLILWRKKVSREAGYYRMKTQSETKDI